VKYIVSAELLPGKAKGLYKILIDGTVKNQKPDGMEIIASMKRAKVTNGSAIEWNEECYCATPLAHERSTVYDHYFTNISANLVDEFEHIEGESFWEFLEKEAMERS
jgi:hypothetical protein